MKRTKSEDTRSSVIAKPMTRAWVRLFIPSTRVAFHPVHGTFATGGGDGYVNFWDGDAKKRLFQSPRYPTSISALAFSPCGSLLAVASSYAHEERENNKPEDRLFLRETRAEEVTPKSAKTS